MQILFWRTLCVNGRYVLKERIKKSPILSIILDQLLQRDGANYCINPFNTKQNGDAETFAPHTILKKYLKKSLQRVPEKRSSVLVKEFVFSKVGMFSILLLTFMHPLLQIFHEFNPFLANVPILCPLKHQKTKGYLVFSGVIKWEYWPEIG